MNITATEINEVNGMNNYTVVDLHARFTAVDSNIRYCSLFHNYSYIYELAFQILCETDLMHFINPMAKMYDILICHICEI
jgi:hypothetical protein